MKRLVLSLTLSPFALLAACGGAQDDGTRGTDISVNAKDGENSTVAIKADGETGKVSVNVPGFDASVSLPKMNLGSGDFDIDGVKLYPGSRVSSVNVNADSSGKGDKAVVKIAFSAPAEIGKVRAWFANSFTDKGVKAKATPTGFAGDSGGDGRFTMTLTPDGTTATTGSVEIIDGDGWSGDSAGPTPPTPPSPPPAP